MADSKDDTGKGASRPYATIDLKATEVSAQPGADASLGREGASGSIARGPSSATSAPAWPVASLRCLRPFSSAAPVAPKTPRRGRSQG